jgi:hypothetical protein
MLGPANGKNASLQYNNRVPTFENMATTSSRDIQTWFTLAKISREGMLIDLGRVDDGCEAVDAEHAQVGDGERASCELMRLQLVGTGLGGQFPHLCPHNALNSKHNEEAPHPTYSLSVQLHY